MPVAQEASKPLSTPSPRVLDPTQVKAVLTSKWEGSGSYKAQTVHRVEQYNVETAIDTDADSWSLELGNIDGDLNDALTRNTEIRVQIFGAGADIVYLMTGITDDVSYTESGTIQLSGRDLSSIATDSVHIPQTYRGLNAAEIIRQEAQELGFEKFNLAPVPGGPKRQYTDGSETYWEFWYRLIRKEKLWLWCEPDGTLTSALLTSGQAKYAFGTVPLKNDELPITNFSFHKSAQQRIWQAQVVWGKQADDNSRQVVTSYDTQIQDWLRKPVKIIENSTVTNAKGARKVADEEIYESKVGALELVVTIPDPGFLIERNTLCTVRLPAYAINGTFFIVGTTVRGDASGFVQEVRLREEGFALSQRTPDDPQWTTAVQQQGKGTAPAPLNPGQGGGKGPNGTCDMSNAQYLNIVDADKLAAAINKYISDEKPNSPMNGTGKCMVEQGVKGGMNPVWIAAIARLEGVLGTSMCGWFNTWGWNCSPGHTYDFSSNSWCDVYLEYAKAFSGTYHKSGKNNTIEDVGPKYCCPEWAPDIRGRVEKILGLAGDALDCTPIPGSEPQPPPGGWPPGTVPPGGAGKPPTADKNKKSAPYWAQRVLDYEAAGRIRLGNNEHDQLSRVVQGQTLHNQCGNDVYLDWRVPAVLSTLMDSGYSLGTFAIVEDHHCNSGRHPLGLAVDVDLVGTVKTGAQPVKWSGSKDVTISIMQFLKGLGDQGLLPTQIICNGNGHDDSDVACQQWDTEHGSGNTCHITTDHWDHIHIGY